MKEHVISKVDSGSIAEEMEIEPGDVLLAVNGKEIRDIFDYRMQIQKDLITVVVRKADENAGEWELEIEKDPYEDLGLSFESGLMDDYRSCKNGCVFCFIDQMPKGMRDTLYFKDDDARLSFLQGNYVTLTNMTDREIDRILEYHLSPINVSFHTTNPELRVKMLRNPKAGEALEKARRLSAEGTGIELNGQIVLCKGLNDGAELERSLHELFYDYAPGLRSVSVVPVGLTKHRDKLYPLEPFTREDAIKTLDIIHAFQEKAFAERGVRFVYAGDEWYFLAADSTTSDFDKLFPEDEAYDGYVQLENGVGMTRLMMDEFRAALHNITSDPNINITDLQSYKNEISFCTGMLFYPVLQALFQEARAVAPGLTVHLYPVKNEFFGERITVSGLLTGGDIIRSLRGKRFGKKLYLPGSVLRAGERVLLDDVTVDQIADALKIEVAISGHSGYDLVAALFDADHRV